MLHELFGLLSILLCLLLLLLALGPGAGSPEVRQNYLPMGLLLLLCWLAYALTPATPRARIERYKPAIAGTEAGLRLGLWAQTQLPPRQPQHPPVTWLQQTLGGRHVIQKPIVIFRTPAQASFRMAGLRRSFRERFGWADALQVAFAPRAIIAHSTEGEDEAHAFAIFDRNTSAQYLGGVWTHFAVGPEGQIYQYGPLNRISKGQAGLDDLAVGIEIVGNASLWDAQGRQTRQGSIMRRWQTGDRRQIRAVQDLIHTLQQRFEIPPERLYSHEDLGKIRDRRGTFPDYLWLRRNIRDRVYLELEPSRDAAGRVERQYTFLEPYDRQDPGQDVMDLLHHTPPSS